MKVLFLNPPSFKDFDGGAGSRYQAQREVRSFWYPTWLAYPAGMLPDSLLLDAPAANLGVKQTLDIARNYDLTVFYTSTPSLKNDIATAERLKREKPTMKVTFVGPHPTVLPRETLQASPVIDFVVRKEFDYAIPDFAKGRPLAEIPSVTWRREDGEIVQNPLAPELKDLDSLPFAADVYLRDLKLEHYEIPWMLNPYVSVYTGRGCGSQCTFCLWPQTFSGNRYRVRSADNVVEEVGKIVKYWPKMRQYFFDDDTFTENQPRAREISRKLARFGKPWGCNSKVTVSYETLKEMRDAGCRVLVAGFESGSNQILKNIQKGATVQQAYEFARNCRKLGILVHGTFIVGLPGETRETLEESMRFACELDIDTIQVSLASPYPGTKFYDHVIKNGYMTAESLVSEYGYQTCNVSYPGVTSQEIFDAMERFYRRFYFRGPCIRRIVGRMLRDRDERNRKLREGLEFVKFMLRRRAGVSAAQC